jgi:hypothetical protein
MPDIHILQIRVLDQVIEPCAALTNLIQTADTRRHRGRQLVLDAAIALANIGLDSARIRDAVAYTELQQARLDFERLQWQHSVDSDEDGEGWKQGSGA